MLAVKSLPVNSGSAQDLSRVETVACAYSVDSGKSLSEIATQRGFALSTIEGHLAEFVLTGEVNAFDFLNEDQIKQIRKAAEEVGYEKYSNVKHYIGDSISYGQVKIGLNYLRSKKLTT